MRMSPLGRLQPVALGLSERLLLWVKQSVNTYNLLHGERLQSAQAV